MEPLEVIEGRDWLGFAGIASPSLYMIPREQQFAEKLHAYTLPRHGRANTRVRDLVDMVLLIHSGTLAQGTRLLKQSASLSIAERLTPVPNPLPQPPTDWQKPYDALAKECGLSGTIDDAFAILDRYVREGGIVETKLTER